MEEGENLARTIPTSNPDPDQEQGGLGVWCGVNRQRAERSRALGPVRPTSDATRAANAAQPTTRRRRQRRLRALPPRRRPRAAASEGCILGKINELGEDGGASDFKKNMADFCGVSFKGAFEGWAQELREKFGIGNGSGLSLINI